MEDKKFDKKYPIIMKRLNENGVVLNMKIFLIVTRRTDYDITN